MQGLMMDMPLLLSGIIQYAADWHGDTEVVGREIEGDVLRTDYRTVNRRAKQMALALKRLGIRHNRLRIRDRPLCDSLQAAAEIRHHGCGGFDHRLVVISQFIDHTDLCRLRSAYRASQGVFQLRPPGTG